MRKDVAEHEYRRGSPPVCQAEGEVQHVVAIYRRASFALVFASMGVLALLLPLARVGVDLGGPAVVAWIAAAMLSVSSLWQSRHGRTRLADALGTIGLLWAGAVSCGAIAMLSLRLQLPLADGMLLAADRALGLDALKVVAWLIDEGQWIFSAMAIAYSQTIPLLLVSILALALVGARLEAWRAAFCFIGSLFSICVAAIVTPAKGLGLWAPAEMLARLPDDAMRYFWANFDSFYAGRDPVLGLDTIDGVISFPSLHAAMGLTILLMWRTNAALLAIAGVWFVFMMLATLPYGGHYIVDLIAGLGIAAAWFALSRWIERRAAPSGRPSRSASS